MSAVDTNKTNIERMVEIYEYVNRKFFHPPVEARIEVRIPRGMALLSVKTAANSDAVSSQSVGVPASQWAFETNTVTFHPALFMYKAPRYVLIYLMYHELCHGELPPAKGEDVHHPRFMRKEVLAPRRNEASRWLRQHQFPTMETHRA